MDIKKIFDTLNELDCVCAGYSMQLHMEDEVKRNKLDAFIERPFDLNVIEHLINSLPDYQPDLIEILQIYRVQLIELKMAYDQNPELIRNQFYLWLAQQLQNKSRPIIVDTAIVYSRQRQDKSVIALEFEAIFIARKTFVNILLMVREQSNHIPFFSPPPTVTDLAEKQAALTNYFNQHISESGLQTLDHEYSPARRFNLEYARSISSQIRRVSDRENSLNSPRNSM